MLDCVLQQRKNICWARSPGSLCELSNGAGAGESCAENCCFCGGCFSVVVRWRLCERDQRYIGCADANANSGAQCEPNAFAIAYTLIIANSHARALRNSHANPCPNGDSNADACANCDSNADADSNSYTNANRYANPDCYTHAGPELDFR